MKELLSEEILGSILDFSIVLFIFELFKHAILQWVWDLLKELAKAAGDRLRSGAILLREYY